MTTDDSPPTSDLIDGRYRLLECVGQGGMARVYRAEDTLLGRIVAIKLLRAGLEGDDSTAGRARGEMTALASLNHPALVTLYDAQLVPGRLEYLVMEFVDGPTLAERISRGPIPPAEVATLAADLAEALHVVHSAGIVHRDIKPSNVLMSRAPFPTSRSGAKLADFGISALVDSARLTSPGIVIGTAAYIAPEQLKGAMPAPAADIYSLGLVMLEALTGARAFPQAEGIGAAMARLTTAPEVPTGLGPGWAELLTAMTAVDPGDRPAAADVFSAASDLAGASAPPPRPTMPAAVAAAALAAGAAAPMAASASASTPAPADAMTDAMTEASEGAAATRVLNATPREGEEGGEPRSRRRRLGLVGAAAATAAGAAILAGAWMAGNAVPEPAATNPADTRKSPAATPMPSAPVETPYAVVPENTQGDRESKEDRKAEEEAAKKAAEAAKKAEEAAKKAEEEQRKAEEEARKEAEEEAEEAEEDQQENEEEQTPDESEGSAEPSPSPTG